MVRIKLSNLDFISIELKEKTMNKNILASIFFATTLSIPMIATTVTAGEASCVIKGGNNEILYRDKCLFQQFGGNGSFSIFVDI